MAVPRLPLAEPAHISMRSSLYARAAETTPDLGAFLYALHRLPARIWETGVVVMGQEARAFARAGLGDITRWPPAEAPARRRRWFDDGEGTMAVLLASSSDLDDLLPTLVAYQVEWNKIDAVVRAAGLTGDDPALDGADLADAVGGEASDWARV